MMTVSFDHEAAAAAVKQLLAAFGTVHDAHTDDTPDRAARGWAELLSGYSEDPAQHLARTFPAPVEPGSIIVSGIEVRSVCAHHLLPFTGIATVAYRPERGQNIVGLSKLARVVAGYSRRLQVQERIGDQVVTALGEQLNPLWAICVISATHECMRLRGVCAASSRTTTVAKFGAHTETVLSEVLAEHRCSLGQ